DGIRDKLVTGVQTCALPICCRLKFGRYSPESGAVALDFRFSKARRTTGHAVCDAFAISSKPAKRRLDAQAIIGQICFLNMAWKGQCAYARASQAFQFALWNRHFA